MEQSAVNTFYAKLKETAFEMFEMLKTAYSGEQVCLNSIRVKGSEMGSESGKAKIAGENNVGCIFLC
jgi:hypothetical protein